MSDQPGAADPSDAGGRSVDIEWLRSTKPDTEYNRKHGFEVIDADVGRVVMAMPKRDWMLNPGGNVSGGVVASLIDIACAPAILSELGEFPGPLRTTELNVSYIRPAGEGLQAEAEVIRLGDQQAVIEVEVTGLSPDGDRKVTAKGRVTYQLPG